MALQTGLKIEKVAGLAVGDLIPGFPSATDVRVA